MFSGGFTHNHSYYDIPISSVAANCGLCICDPYVRHSESNPQAGGSPSSPQARFMMGRYICNLCLQNLALGRSIYIQQEHQVVYKTIQLVLTHRIKASAVAPWSKSRLGRNYGMATGRPGGMHGIDNVRYKQGQGPINPICT